MTSLVLPRLQGQAWPVKRMPTTSTRIASHVSGREVRTPLWAYPLYQFEILFEALSSNTAFPGVAEKSLEELQGFYLACGGTLTPFLYIDPVDNTATGQVLGTGDGATTTFAFQRSVGSKWIEPVGWVTSVSTVYVGGVAVPGSAWTLAQPASLVFALPPAAGAIILADFNYAFLCRFMDDQVEFDHFMWGLWSMPSLKFKTFR